jgi:hypothetical protein
LFLFRSEQANVTGKLFCAGNVLLPAAENNVLSVALDSYLCIVLQLDRNCVKSAGYAVGQPAPIASTSAQGACWFIFAPMNAPANVLPEFFESSRSSWHRESTHIHPSESDRDRETILLRMLLSPLVHVSAVLAASSLQLHATITAEDDASVAHQI